VAYTIELTPEALGDLARLRRIDQKKIAEAIEKYLRHQPTQTSQSRIKQLRSGTQPRYRLRIDPFRVFYNVDTSAQLVKVHGVVLKDKSLTWLREFAEQEVDEEDAL
jgi:mRNA-degrading endonuclease RelE of RelBE toxin-antitoxin system